MENFTGYFCNSKGGKLEEKVYGVGAIQSHEVDIKVTHCGMCYSDIHSIDNDWGETTYPFVPGHEIVGTVAQAGEQSPLKVGQRVGLGW